MTTPIRPVPREVNRWVSLCAWLRRADALVAWGLVWAALQGLPRMDSARAAVLAAIVVALGALIRPLRVVWRPASGAVGLAISRDLHPGDRAWYVRSGHADLVLVTARHGARLVIAPTDLQEPDEVLTIRRTRVLFVPADGLRHA
jgi:hypothetical protein